MLRPGARLAWIELLAYVKANGVGGRVKAIPAAAAGRRWAIPTRDVEAMLEAAQQPHSREQKGALQIVDGDWLVTKWSEYQESDPNAAERMRRLRSRKTTTSTPLRRNVRNVQRNPSRDRDVDVDVDIDLDRDRTAGESARAPEVATPNGGPPDFDAYQPTDAQRARAAQLHVDLTRALNSWRGKRKAAGATPHDLAGDFDGWLEDEPQYQHTNGNGASGGSGPKPLLHSLPNPWTQPPPEPEPEIDPEQRAEVARMARETAAALAVPGTRPTRRGEPMPQTTESDPEVIRQREETKRKQLAIARGEKP